jgi:hypothetical protein
MQPSSEPRRLPSRRDRGMTALIEGFFGFVWFGWGQADATSGLRPVLAAGGVLALLVAVAGAFQAFRNPVSDSSLHDPRAWRRYGVIVGVEFALAGAGAAALAAAWPPGSRRARSPAWGPGRCSPCSPPPPWPASTWARRAGPQSPGSPPHAGAGLGGFAGVCAVGREMGSSIGGPGDGFRASWTEECHERVRTGHGGRAGRRRRPPDLPDGPARLRPGGGRRLHPAAGGAPRGGGRPLRQVGAGPGRAAARTGQPPGGVAVVREDRRGGGGAAPGGGPVGRAAGRERQAPSRSAPTSRPRPRRRWSRPARSPTTSAPRSSRSGRRCSARPSRYASSATGCWTTWAGCTARSAACWSGPAGNGTRG